MDFLFDDIFKHEIFKIGKELWVTVHREIRGRFENGYFHCALVPMEMKNKALSCPDMDLDFSSGVPGFIKYYHEDGNETKYYRFGNDEGVEPLVYHRDFVGIRPPCVEISEEFRHYHNLYYDQISNNYYAFDKYGDEDEVVAIEEHQVRIKLKYLKEFLSIKHMSLAVYVSIDRVSNKTLSELGLKEYQDVKNGDNYIFRKYIGNFDFSDEGRTLARLYGKVLIDGLDNFELDNVWETKKEEYESFIIGIDGNGVEVEYTCNKCQLSDFFGKNPDAPNYLTPIFFRREVLAKYYTNPEKYSVEDGIVKCGYTWSLNVDNNHKKHLMVYLGDLGGLSNMEQQYWRSFNIASDSKISRTNFMRSWLGEFAEPENEDLVFKDAFTQLQGKWLRKYDWPLFKPLTRKDEHYFKTLRIPLNNDQSEFDNLVAALTKVMIDSLNEKEIAKYIKEKGGELEHGKGGLYKFDIFLTLNDYPHVMKTSDFLKDLQALRSTGSAHRKGDNYNKISKKFCLDDTKPIEVFTKILSISASLMLDLDNHFLSE